MENGMDPAHTAFLHTIISGSQFTNEFGVMPELEFVETRVGMMSIGTRRVEHARHSSSPMGFLPSLAAHSALDHGRPAAPPRRSRHPFREAKAGRAM
jgi:hypothetical protein